MAIETIQGEISAAPHNNNYVDLDNRVTSVQSQTNSKIGVAVFTATANATTNIIHNLTYNPITDDLLVVYGGLFLEVDINYQNNINNISINLLGWSINIGEKIGFKIYRNVK